MAGYNPNMSLLPSAGGTIHAMSGGGGSGAISGGAISSGAISGGAISGGSNPPMGYNPNNSVLPSVGGLIPSYSGGFYNQPMESEMIGAGPKLNPFYAKGAKGAKSTKDVVAPAPTTSATATTATPATIPVAPITPIPTTPATTPATPLVPAPTNKNVVSNTPTIDITDTNTKPITLFGTSLILEKPEKNSKLTSSQTQTLELLGLDGEGLSSNEKFEVIQALYDGKCDTDKPVIFLQNCEPIRRIIQSLALNLLSKLGTDGKANVNGISKEEKPEITQEKLLDGSMRICLVFKPNQLHLLSKFTPKKISNASTGTENATKKPVVNTSTGTENATKKPDVTVPTETDDVTKKSDVDTSTGTENATKKPDVDALLKELKADPSLIGISKVPRQLTPEEKAELDRLLKELQEIKEPIVVNGTAVTNEEAKKEIEELKKRLDALKESPKNIEQIAGSALITTLGIQNPNTWCYSVSAIQFMFSIPAMRDAILKYTCEPAFKFPTSIDEIEQITTVDNNGVLCALKMIFEELNKSITSFTDKDYESKFINQNVSNNLPVAYLIKMYLLGQKATNIKGSISTNINNNQQDVDEFLRIIFNIIDKNSELKNILNVFKWNRKTQLICEDSAFKKDERTDKEAELTIQLDANNFISETNISYKNKISGAMIGDGISLQDLINYYSKSFVPSMKMPEDPSKIPDYAKNPDGSIKPEALTSDNRIREQLEGCGEPVVDGVALGRGYYTESYKISPAETNKFLVFQINKGGSIINASSIQDIKIKAEPQIIINDKFKYNIFGAILYAGTGKEGHYMYERLYNPEDSKYTKLSDVPFIMYNSGEVTPNKLQPFNILDNATHIIYQKVDSAITESNTSTPSDTSSDTPPITPSDTPPITPPITPSDTPPITPSDTPSITPPVNNITPYEILGVEKEGLTRNILKRAYRKKALETHPNKGGDTEEFKKLKNAYDTLLELFPNNISNNTLSTISNNTSSTTLSQLTNEAFRESVNKVLKDSEIPLILNKDYNNLPEAIKLLSSESILPDLNNSTKAKLTELLPILKGYKEALDKKNVPQFLAIMNKNQNKRNLLNSSIKNKGNNNIESNTINITETLANPLKTKLGQIKKKFSNSTRFTSNKTKTNHYQQQAAAVKNNMNRLIPGKKITQKNLNNIRKRLETEYNSVRGGKRKTFKNKSITKRKTMKKYKK